KEGWDGSPLWVIRAHHSGEFVPGKLAVKHRSAYIPHAGKEVPVLCAPAHALRWLPASNGEIPVGGIAAGNTHNAEPLYVARVRHLRSITPGKVHPSHGCCYISFGGTEIPYKSYEVLCKIVG
ncbi:Farnesoic acid O-methyltransferase, partial [Operophtera brumata]